MSTTSTNTTMTSSQIKTRRTTTSLSCITGPSRSIRMNPSPLSPPKSKSSTTSSASTSTSVSWTPSGSTGCTTAVCIYCKSKFPMLIEIMFRKKDVCTKVPKWATIFKRLSKPLLPVPPQLVLSPCWTSVPLSPPASAGWSSLPLMMLTGSTPKAVWLQRITHSWENAEVRAELCLF